MCVLEHHKLMRVFEAPRMHPNKFGTDGTNSITHFPIFFKGGVENFTLAPCSARNTMADAVRVWTWNYIKSNAAHAGEHKMQRFLGKYIWVRLSVCQEVFCCVSLSAVYLFLRKGSLLSAASCVLKAAHYTHEVLGNYI